MIEPELISLISNVGFPIAIVIYFLVRLEKIINNNTQALTNFRIDTIKCKGGNTI